MLDIVKKTNFKIAYCMDLSDYLGGAGNHLLRHAMLSKLAGINVLMCIPLKEENQYNNIIEELCKDNNLEYVYIDYETSHNFNINIRKVLKSMNEFIKLSQEKNIKIFHSVQLNVGVEMASRILNIPHIMSIYQLDKYEFYPNYPNIFPRFTHSDSNLYAGIWSSGLNAYSKCIRSWIPKKFFCDFEYERMNSNIKLMMSGAICSRKGQAKVIEVVARLKEKGYTIELFLFGYANVNDPYVQQCTELIIRYELEKNIHICGFTKDIHDKMNGMTALVCASNDESFPQVILEAMAMKIPVISTPVAGVPELLKNNYNAFITRDFTIESLENIIEQFIIMYEEDSEEISKIVDQSFLTVNSVSSEERVKTELLSYYEYVLEHINSNNEDKNDYIDLISNIKSSLDTTKSLLKDSLNEQQLGLYFKNEFRVKYIIEFLNKLYGNRKIKCLIWGTGGAANITTKVIEKLLPNFELVGYIDNFKDGVHNNKPIISHIKINIEEIEYVFIGTTLGKYDAVEYLSQINFKAGYNYFDLII